jgi:hypothetical protein
VAGIVIGDALRLAVAGGFLAQAKPGKEDGDVHHPLGKGFGAGLISGAAQDEVVFAHGGPAPGGVGDDGVHIRREGVEVAAREGAGGVPITGMPRQAATAALAAGDDDLHPVAGEHLDRGSVDIRIEHLLGAAGQQGHAGTAFAASGRDAGPGLGGRHAGRREVEH